MEIVNYNFRRQADRNFKHNGLISLVIGFWDLFIRILLYILLT